MIKLHVRQDEDGMTRVAVIKHADPVGVWGIGGGDFMMTREVNPDNDSHWRPVAEGVRVESYFTFAEDVGVEIHPPTPRLAV